MSGYDGKPGFSQQLFDTLKEKAAQDIRYRRCAVMIDEIHIRKRLDWDAKKKSMIGFVDLGAGPNDDDTQKEATEALVIMAVGITGHWKVSLGYFLIAGLGAKAQTQLVKQSIAKLYDVGIEAVALVMDGLSTNQSMATILGCSLNPDKIKANFPHPCYSQLHVAVIFDACHMLKLSRNALAALGEFQIPNRGTVKWEHIKKLNELQQNEGLRAGTRLTSEHVNFEKQKMKVRLASQTFSSSVATALNFARQLKIPGLSDSETTEFFVRMIDRLFDIFNSKSRIAKGFKEPLTKSNLSATLRFLVECSAIFMQMQDPTGTKLCYTRRNMFAIGFLVNIRSLQSIANHLLYASENPLEYILTYKLSQGHLELFFSAVRSANGWNNNPSAKQFSATYRALLHHSGVNAGINSNVLPQDGTELMYLVENSGQISAESLEPIFQESFIDEHTISISRLSPYVMNVLEYIGGWVVRKLIEKLSCADCKSLLIQDVNQPKQCSGSLLQLKNNGGLLTPSEGVQKVLVLAEKEIRASMNIKQIVNSHCLGMQLEANILKSLPNNLFPTGSDHFLDTLHGIENHFISLVRGIIRQFVILRRHEMVKISNLALRGQSLRQHLTKTIIFNHQ